MSKQKRTTIWLVVVGLILIVTAGLLGNYLGAGKMEQEMKDEVEALTNEKTQLEKQLSGWEEKVLEKTIEGFMIARMNKDYTNSKQYLTKKAQNSTEKTDIISSSNLKISDYEILRMDKFEEDSFEVGIELTEKYIGQGESGATDNYEQTMIWKKVEEDYKVDNVN